MQAPFDFEWNPPLPLPEGVSLLPWPDNVFPELFENFAKELSRSTETPIELSSMLILSTLAAATQKRYEVQIKPDYSEPVNIWTVAILPPASRKSKVYAEVTLPLREWEVAKKLAVEPRIQSINSKRKTMEARLKELRVQASKTSECKYELLQQQIENLERDMPEVPGYPQLWTSDITPEHLGAIMAVNEEAMVVMSDEGCIFDILSGLYSDGKANIDLFLQAHSASPVRVDRGSRPPVFMQKPVLTMGLTVQPSVIKNICSNKTFKGRGLLGRFLYVMPKSNIGFRTLDEPSMEPSIKHRFHEAIKKLLEHPNNIEDEKKNLNPLRMNPDGYAKWLEYAKAIELFMGKEMGHLSHITDWAGKLPGAIARIAGLLHIMRYAHQKPWQFEISIEDISAAIKIGHCLTNHALAVFDLLQEDTSLQLAKDILQWIIENKCNSFTRRECLRKFRRVKKAELNPALEILEENDIIKGRGANLIKSQGRPVNLFDINPFMFKK